jgi:hypothetical protein
MKTLLSYVFFAVAALFLVTALGFVLGSYTHEAVARVMHAVATI